MTVADARQQFPHLQTEQVYFNHAALGPWCRLALKRIDEYASQRSGGKIENYSSFLSWSQSAKEKLGQLIGAEPVRIAWCDNVSNALNILAQGLDWKSGDRVILNDIEFPSNVYPFLNLQQEGVEIDFVKSKNGIIEFEDLEKLVTPRTKLISISLVQFLSGYRADIDLIGDLCRRKGIIFCVDGIQAVGTLKVNVEKSKIDFFAGGTQKWLLSSQGLSYFYLTEELQSRIKQKFVGWTSVVDAWNLLQYDLTLKPGADKFQNGTLNALGVAIFDSVLDLFLEFGVENCEARILENTGYFIEKLEESGFDPVLKNVPVERRAGIVSIRHEKSNQIFEELVKRKIYAAVREGMIRFSPHFYNTADEIARVVSALKEVQSLFGLRDSPSNSCSYSLGL